MKKINYLSLLALLIAALMLLAACGANDTDRHIERVEKLFNAKFDDHFWDNIFEYMMDEVPHDQWNEILDQMPWSYSTLNTFNAHDTNIYGTETWTFVDGKFTIAAGSWHFVEWSYNIKWDVAPDSYDEDRTASVVNTDEDAYILCLLGDYYFYLVEISQNEETAVACLAEDFEDDFYVLSAEEYAATNETTTTCDETHLARVEELFTAQRADDANYWDAVMTYLVTEVPRDQWQAILSQMPWSYDSINTFNAHDTNIYGDDSWSFADGKFTIAADSWHFVDWSYNIEWDISPDSYDEDRTASVVNTDEDAYILCLLGDYYFYLVEISQNEETAIACLGEEFVDQFYIYMPVD